MFQRRRRGGSGEEEGGIDLWPRTDAFIGRFLCGLMSDRLAPCCFRGRCPHERRRQGLLPAQRILRVLSPRTARHSPSATHVTAGVTGGVTLERPPALDPGAWAAGEDRRPHAGCTHLSRAPRRRRRHRTPCASGLREAPRPHRGERFLPSPPRTRPLPPHARRHPDPANGQIKTTARGGGCRKSSRT